MKSPDPLKPLDVSPDDFRSLSRRVLDLAAQFLDELPVKPAFPAISGESTTERFSAPLGDAGLGEKALDALVDVIAMSRPPSPRFYGYVLGSGEPVAALADLLASVLNQNVTAWRSSPAAVTIERQVVQWLASALGCEGFAGSLCGGGSAANLMALTMAREATLPANETGLRPGIVYASTEVHMSIPKAMGLLGLGRSNLRLISVDEEFRMRPEELHHAVGEDVAAGRKPLAVIGTAGSVNTGAIDPLLDIAELCDGHGLWFHVDGAYGALAALARPDAFAGLARADSISLDPHKWLYQPVDCGLLLYRDRVCARAAFSFTGDYARALESDPVEGFAFFEESMELSRRFRALKLWLSLRYHGLGAFREAIRQDLRHAQMLTDVVRATPELELLAPVQLSAVCFRYRGSGLAPGAAANRRAPDPTVPEPGLDGEQSSNELNAAILKRLIARGRVYLSNATIRGRFALRACFVNHRTTDADVAEIVPEVIAAAGEVCGG